MLFLLLPLVFADVTPSVAPPPTAATAEAPPQRVVHLADAVALAVKNQPAMTTARANTDAAEGRAGQARAGLFPQVTLSASAQEAYGNLGSRVTAGSTAGGATSGTSGGSTPVVTGATPSPGNYALYNVGGNVYQLLFDFGQVWGRTRAADHLAEAAKESEKSAELLAIRQVRTAYFTALGQRGLVTVGEQNVTNLQLHLNQIEGFARAGTRPEIDLAQARTDLANGRLSLIQAQNALAISKAQLSQAMGVPGDASFELADDELGPIDGEEASSEELAKRALSARPEISALNKQLEGQASTVRSIKGAYGPTLAAVGGASESGTSATGLQPSWNAGLSLQWAVFQGGLTNSQLREAEANMDVTRSQVEAQKLQIRFDIDQARLNLKAARASEEATADVATNARVRLRLAEGRYASGVGSVIELSDAQVAMTNAQAQVVSAHYNLLIARAQLLAALGRR